MGRRILSLLLFYLWLVTVCSLARPVFLLCYDGPEMHSWHDYMDVITHGWVLDLAWTGYLAAIPFLFIVVSCYVSFPVRKALCPWLAIASFLTSLGLVADISLYEFWSFKLDATVLAYLDSPTEAMASVSTGYVLLRVVIVLVLAVVILIPLAWSFPSRFAKLSRAWQSLVLLPVAGLIFLGIRGGTDESTANVSMAYYSSEELLNHSAVNPCFSFVYSLGKNDDFSRMYGFMEDKVARDIVSDSFYLEPESSESDSTSIVLRTQRPNILLLIWEGLGGVMTQKIGGDSITTPNFNRLCEEGLYFSQYYSSSFRTDRGTLSAISGYPACPKVSIMKNPAVSRTLPSIPSSLRGAGYHSMFLYGGDINFTNMNSYLLTMGYESTVSMYDFPHSDRTNPWGVDDGRTFSWLYDRIGSMDKSAPWHIGYLTLSSHEPWQVPYSRLDDERRNSFAYTDACLGDFVSKLKNTPQWDNLLIIIIPDHGCQGQDLQQSRKMFFHCPMLWLGGALAETGVVDRIMSQSDIAATLLSQLGLDHGAFRFSRDVLSSSYRGKEFSYSCFNDGFMVVGPDGYTVWDNGAGQVTEGDGDKKRIELGKAIMQDVHRDLQIRKTER